MCYDNTYIVFVSHVMSLLYTVTVTHYRAVRILQDTGNTFTLTVAKHAADFYGISYNTSSTKVSSLDRQGDHHGDHQGWLVFLIVSS